MYQHYKWIKNHLQSPFIIYYKNLIDSSRPRSFIIYLIHYLYEIQVCTCSMYVGSCMYHTCKLIFPLSPLRNGWMQAGKKALCNSDWFVHFVDDTKEVGLRTTNIYLFYLCGTQQLYIWLIVLSLVICMIYVLINYLFDWFHSTKMVTIF